MKNLPLNISSMKKIAGDKHSSTFQHKDGHKIIVAHAPLPAIQRKQLERLPLAEGGDVKGVHKSYYDDGEGGASKVGALARNLDLKKGRKEMAINEHHIVRGEMQQIKPKLKGLADGGEVDQEDSTPVVQDPDATKSFQDSFRKATHYKDGTDDVQSPDQSQSVPDQSSQHTININVGQPQQPASPANIYGNEPVQAKLPNLPGAQSGANLLNANATANVPQAVSQEMKLAPEQQALDAQSGQNKSAEESAYNKQAAAQAQQDQEHINDMKQHTEEFAKWNQDPNNQVNPNHWAETRALGKTGAAMSLFLSGFAGGMGNAGPMHFINSQIDRDIDAQKSRIGQQKSIFEAYNKLYDNQNIASNLTKVSLNDLYAHRMNQIADKIGTQQAKINAQMFQAHKTLENQQILRQASADPDMDTAYRHAQAVQGKGGDTNQIPSVPYIDENGKAVGVSNKEGGNEPQEASSAIKGFKPEHVLSPSALKKINSASIAQLPGWDDASDVNGQAKQAQQLEKVFNGPKGDGKGGIDDYINQMYTNSGQGNYISGAGGAIQRGGSKLTNALSHLIGGQSTDLEIPAYSSATKAYETNQQNLKTLLASSLHGLISVNDLDHMVNKYSPGYGDKEGDVEKKREDFKNELRRALVTTNLEKHKLLAPGFLK